MLRSSPHIHLSSHHPLILGHLPSLSACQLSTLVSPVSVATTLILNYLPIRLHATSKFVLTPVLINAPIEGSVGE